MSNNVIRQKVQNWLKKHGHILNKNAFEREIGISKGVIQKFLKYDKKLNDETIKKIYRYLLKLKSI